MRDHLVPPRPNRSRHVPTARRLPSLISFTSRSGRAAVPAGADIDVILVRDPERHNRTHDRSEIATYIAKSVSAINVGPEESCQATRGSWTAAEFYGGCGSPVPASLFTFSTRY